MGTAFREAFDITSNYLKEEGLFKDASTRDVLEKWIDIKKKRHCSGASVLLKYYPVFKLKRKKIKNRKYRLVRNTKKYVFLIRDFVPTSVGFGDHSDARKDTGFSWSVDLSLTANVLRKIKGVAKEQGVFYAKK